MKFEENTLRFFLGANTPQGFVSRFDQLADVNKGWKKFIIKGGPGSGKSTMMKKIAAEYKDICPKMELIHCSSDADSLDGVILPDRKVSIADGTPPHVRVPFIINCQSPHKYGIWWIVPNIPMEQGMHVWTNPNSS